MSSDAGDETRISPGFPIRTPSDHSPVIDSPRLIADSNVLHRFLVPRHPPCALKNLTTKMLASTMQFSTHQPTPTRHPRITREQQTSEATHQSKPATADPSDTQQRTTRPPHQTHHAFPTPFTQKDGRTHDSTPATAANDRCSTHEHTLEPPHTGSITSASSIEEAP